ncbi:hypothetical protein GQ53DRAFT_357580 [Thozetella sp. PMI_491]|nr:hypothetical protein GQ53DRAFT_357580 [Thozetella sp. PMI_491]
MSSTLLPFLYQTRTLQRLYTSRAGATNFRALSTTPSCRARRQFVRSNDIPFELPEDFPVTEVGRKKTKSAEDSEGDARGTITPSEREAFNRIFEEIAARGQAADSLGAVQPSDPAAGSIRLSDEPESPLTPSNESGKVDPEVGRDIVNVIIQDAEQKYVNARRTAMQPYDPLHPLEQISSARDRNLAFLKFPPSLREAAGIALGSGGRDSVLKRGTSVPEQADTQSEEGTGASITAQSAAPVMDPLAKDIKMEALRRPERTRIERRMKNAQSDFQLWDVMEAEVFTMVQKLGLTEGSPRKARRNKASVKATAELNLDVHGPLYPELLLLGLRQMDQAFGRSSPLALSILPRIKELGLASYVLGISTSFYYQLMVIQWHRYGNITAVLNLLEEMRHAGLSFDHNCLRVVDAVNIFHKEATRGDHGIFLQQLMRMPEFEHMPYRFKHWTREIMNGDEQLQGRLAQG